MGEVSPALFQKLEKSVEILGKNALIVAIYGLHFSCGLRVSRTRNPKFYPVGPFFHVLYIKCLSKWPDTKKITLH